MLPLSPFFSTMGLYKGSQPNFRKASGSVKATRMYFFFRLDLIDLYFKLCGTNMLHKKQIIHKIYNEMTAGGKQGSSNVNKMFCALEC